MAGLGTAWWGCLDRTALAWPSAAAVVALVVGTVLMPAAVLRRTGAWAAALVLAVSAGHGWWQAAAGLAGGVPGTGVTAFAAGSSVVALALALVALPPPRPTPGTTPAACPEPAPGVAPAAHPAPTPGVAPAHSEPTPGTASTAHPAPTPGVAPAAHPAPTPGFEPEAGSGHALAGAWEEAALAAAGGPAHVAPAARNLLVAGAGAVVGAVVLAGTLLAVTSLPVDATTAPPATAGAAEVPRSVTRIAWRWQAPSPVRDAVPAGAGVAVRVADGVIALDTATGKERWHYRRSHARAVRLVGAADAGAVLVAFGSPGGERVVLLEARTGTVLSESERPAGFAGHAVLYSRALVTRTGAGRLTGWDLTTGAARWVHDVPKGCVLADQLGLRDAVAMLLTCGADVQRWERLRERRTMSVTVLGLDPATGEESWRHEQAASFAPGGVGARPSDDAALVTVSTPSTLTLLSGTTGRPLPEPHFEGLQLALTATGRVTTDLASGTFRYEPFAGPSKVMTLPWAEGAGPEYVMALDDALLVTVWLDDVLTVTSTPWESGETTRIPVPGGTPPLRAPGAIVVAGGTTVTGLA
ncbi:PQQ-binding-like beta-propeller repeat protein [Nonomuraea sp. NPDC050783]|uniref:outer membrane protein assembly factor BamB family protein n=1 Tax=Nonomuraea sp. NPDC050783 TaxID=3154634 RepID=UPI0034674BEC